VFNFLKCSKKQFNDTFLTIFCLFSLLQVLFNRI
jgi:hypothetical protein